MPLTPLAFDAPRAKALMVGIVPGEMTVSDQSTTSMPTPIVDGFVLAHDLLTRSLDHRRKSGRQKAMRILGVCEIVQPQQ